MEYKKTFGNHVLIKLDPDNDTIKLGNDFTLYIDISFEVEKHATITGEVRGLPSHLYYSGQANKGMPWLTEMELKIGDRVVIYYLSVVNAFQKTVMKYFIKDGEKYVFIPYDKIYAVFGEGFVKPINGYCLVEPTEDPVLADRKRRMEKIGLEMVVLDQKKNTKVTFAKIKYLGRKNTEYADENSTDDGVDVGVGDIVALRKTYDIPLEYELHSKIEKASKLLRVQRRSMLAKF